MARHTGLPLSRVMALGHDHEVLVVDVKSSAKSSTLRRSAPLTQAGQSMTNPANHALSTPLLIAR
jgi:hypothetical protein